MEESDLIDKYLRGELTEKEHDDFVKLIQTDESLQKRTSLRRLVIEGIRIAYTDKLKHDLVEFDKSLDRKNRLKLSWKMAAVFAFLIVAGSIIYLTIKPANPYDFDIVEPGLPNSMGNSNSVKFSNAMNDFKAGDHLASGEIFNSLLSANPKNDTLLYFSGLCDFRNHQTKMAAQKLSLIDSESGFYEKAVYILALTYWTNNDFNKAIELLDEIKKDKNNRFHQQAEKALKVLN